MCVGWGAHGPLFASLFERRDGYQSVCGCAGVWVGVKTLVLISRHEERAHIEANGRHRQLHAGVPSDPWRSVRPTADGYCVT
jgi:hypothetical protein